jgi:hypothetical protein
MSTELLAPRLESQAMLHVQQFMLLLAFFLPFIGSVVTLSKPELRPLLLDSRFATLFNLLFLELQIPAEERLSEFWHSQP